MELLLKLLIYIVLVLLIVIKYYLWRNYKQYIAEIPEGQKAIFHDSISAQFIPLTWVLDADKASAALIHERKKLSILFFSTLILGNLFYILYLKLYVYY